MKEVEYNVVITAHEDAPVGEYLREAVQQLDSVTGVVGTEVEATTDADRDISEVHRIIGDLSATELQQLEDAIDSYTEDER